MSTRAGSLEMKLNIVSEMIQILIVHSRGGKKKKNSYIYIIIECIVFFKNIHYIP